MWLRKASDIYEYGEGKQSFHSTYTLINKVLKVYEHSHKLNVTIDHDVRKIGVLSLAYDATEIKSFPVLLLKV